MTKQAGSVRVAQIAGINIWIHWSWLLLAVVAIEQRRGAYDSEIWNAIEYLSLFGIVLLHEFGHALACRQVGGKSDTIVLWPLGGVAYVSAPQRPSAQLWSIAAGPLVNFALIPIIYFGGRFLVTSGTFTGHGYADFWSWMAAMKWINVRLLVFNLLPIYPLDGGQILRCLLWYVLGPRKSLLWASGVGLVSAIGLGLWALSIGWWWLAVISGYLGANSFRSFNVARSGEGD